MKCKCKKQALWVLFVVLMIFLLGYNSFCSIFSKSVDDEHVTSDQTRAIESRLGALFKLKAKRQEVNVLIYPDKITIGLFERNVDVGYTYPDVLREEYPKLFDEGEFGINFVSAEMEYKDNREYIKLSNNYHNHGGFSEGYFLLVDLETGGIIENEKK